MAAGRMCALNTWVSPSLAPGGPTADRNVHTIPSIFYEVGEGGL